jgi:hypothetical protein
MTRTLADHERRDVRLRADPPAPAWHCRSTGAHARITAMEGRPGGGVPDGPRVSLLSVAGAVALEGCSVEPLGVVTGCVGAHVRRTWAGACGSSATTLGQDAPRAPVRVMTDAAPPGAATAGDRAPVSRLGIRRSALRDALGRMLAQAAALRADGVVDVRLTETPDPDAPRWRAFVATGTAVRVRAGQAGPAAPFASTLDGPRTAAAIGAGWWPAGVAVGLAAVVRHTDAWARVGTGQQLATGEPGELEGLSELVTTARTRARDDLAADAARAGGGHVAVTSSGARTWRQDAAQHVDDVAEVMLVATVLQALAAVSSASSVRPLTVLPLTDAPDPARTRHGGPR